MGEAEELELAPLHGLERRMMEAEDSEERMRQERDEALDLVRRLVACHEYLAERAQAVDCSASVAGRALLSRNDPSNNQSISR